MATASGAVEYCVELYDSGATFGPSTKLAELWDCRNVGWSRYDRIPGKAFFTVYQTSPYIGERSVSTRWLTPLLTHVVITRVSAAADQTVFRGVFYDYDSTGDDVIADCYDYLSLLTLSRSGFKTMYPSKKFGSEIVAPEWALAKGAGSSPLGFVSTGTIQNPLGNDDITELKTSAQFGTLDQNRLQLFFDLTEMGRANTDNHVTFDIDFTDTFNLWKNKGVQTTEAFVLNGNVSDYEYLPGWKGYRNDLATVGSTSSGGAGEIVATDAGEISSRGLRQDVATLRTLIGLQGAATTADQQRAALEYQLTKAVDLNPSVSLRLLRGAVAPYQVAIADKCYIEVQNGLDNIVGVRRVVGWRGMYDEAGEALSVLVDARRPVPLTE